MNNHSSRKAPRNTKRSGDKEPALGPGNNKRERILDAAVRVFAHDGFYNAKVSQIAHAAGVADGTIYLYFKSKDDLLISLFENRMKQVNDKLRQAIAERPPTEQLRAFIQ